MTTYKSCMMTMKIKTSICVSATIQAKDGVKHVSYFFKIKSLF